MPLFDDLFLNELTNDFLSYPIFFTIGISILVSNAWLIVAASVMVALSSELFESGGNIILQPLAASLIVHLTVGLAVYLTARSAR